MPTVTEDFLNPYFWTSLGHAIVNGLWVLLGVSSVAAAFTFLTGGTAPKNWPKKDQPEAEAHH
jgi:hypothetical protein